MASAKQALVILVGITADEMKRNSVGRYFERNSGYDVFVPDMPQRFGVRVCSWWLRRYLRDTVQVDTYDRVSFLNYVSGGIIFRRELSRRPLANIGRVVYDRGPIQEEVPRALVRKYTWFLMSLFKSHMIADVAGKWIYRLPYPLSMGEQGLMIELGTSLMAHDLGINEEDIPAEAWDPEFMLPGADDVTRRSESHDDVYSSLAFLSFALRFFETGKFAEVADPG